jgi:hypothetical protein
MGSGSECSCPPESKRTPNKLGPGSLLIVKAWIGLQELRLSDGIGPAARFQGWGGPPGAGTQLPPQLLALGVSMAPAAQRPVPCSRDQLLL